LEKYSLPTFKRFASKHGYSIYVERLDEDGLKRKSPAAKAARWRKISLLREVLKENKVAVWFDADILIRRYDEDIASHLGPTAFQGLVLESVPAENRTNPNTGVWALNNSPEAFEFLDKVEAVGIPDGRWADQAAVMQALGWTMGDDWHYGAQLPEVGTTFLSGTTWLPKSWNQPYRINGFDPETYVGRSSIERSHALHFMEMTIEERADVMGSVARDLQQHAS